MMKWKTGRFRKGTWGRSGYFPAHHFSVVSPHGRPGPTGIGGHPGTFLVRRLAPWFEDIKKRQIKTPKIYFRDSGILHRWLGIPGMEQRAAWPR